MKLSLFDQVFYKLEQAGMSPVYMGGAMILDTSTSPYPINRAKIADHLAACMEQIPLMRKKLVQDKLRIGDMLLVDDPEFNVKNHISLSRLPKPGGYKELTEFLGEYSGRRMDLTKPLWHYEVVDGLENNRIAVVSHLHHSIMDGMGAQQALTSMWSIKPTRPKKPQSEPWQFDEEPTSIDLLVNAVRDNVENLYFKTPRLALKSAGPVAKMLLKKVVKELNILDKPVSASPKTRVPKVYKTSINTSKVSEKRAVSYAEFPLAEAKALSKQLPCSINDLMLVINSYALQYYFEQVGEEIDFDLVAGMPISTRQEGDNSHGNAVSIGRVNLHNQIVELPARLKAIVEDTSAIKNAHNKSPDSSKLDTKGMIDVISPIILDAALYSIIKLNLLDKVSLINVVITNVPGSPVPLYIAGAKLDTVIPMAPVAAPISITITIASTDDLLVIGYHGCSEAIIDKELFVKGAHKAFNLLKKSVKATPKKKTKAQSKIKAKPKAKPKTKSKVPVKRKTAVRAK